MRGEALAVNLLRGNWTYFLSICWRKERLQKDGCRTDLGAAFDQAMHLDIVAGGGSLVVTEEELFAATAPRMSDLGQHRAATRGLIHGMVGSTR